MLLYFAILLFVMRLPEDVHPNASRTSVLRDSHIELRAQLMQMHQSSKPASCCTEGYGVFMCLKKFFFLE